MRHGGGTPDTWESGGGAGGAASSSIRGEPEFFYDIEQGTPEWYEIRRGIPTASSFKKILAGDKDDKYLNILIGEAISNEVSETYQSAAMARGKDMEAEARDRFTRKTLLDVRQCGFVRREIRPGRFVGCSPDGLYAQGQVGLDSVLEIKTMRPDLMVAQRKNGVDPSVCPSEHEAQVQGALWITGYPRAELIVWYRGMPWDLHYTIQRNEAYIRELAKAVDRFDRALEEQTKQFS